MGYALLFILDAMVIVEPKLGRTIPRRAAERFAARARGAAGLAGRVDVLITTSAAMRRLNRRFLGKDHATDVLSFPAPAAALQRREVNRVILTRPAVEAGERLGFLPGDIAAKVDPYLRPIYYALYDLLEAERTERMMAQGLIEIAPLAFMRDRKSVV